MRIYWFEKVKNGSIGMMARPRGNDWLEDEILKLKLLKVDTVISLLENEEEFELGIENEKILCKKHGINFIKYSIEDRGIPKDEDSFIKLVYEIESKLKSGEKIVTHCRMGIGRASLVIAVTLLKTGYNNEDIFELITKKRTLKVPDTKEQLNWVKALKKN